ncbi:MAG: hypothetical protein WCG25_04210 [bacterium]
MQSADSSITVSIPADTKFVNKADGKPYLSVIAPPREDTAITQTQKYFTDQTIFKAFKV